jgi:hypothetical protein
VLDQAGFDEFGEAWRRNFYHEKLGRPSLTTGIYFRMMLIAFFEGVAALDLPPLFAITFGPESNLANG